MTLQHCFNPYTDLIFKDTNRKKNNKQKGLSFFDTCFNITQLYLKLKCAPTKQMTK